MTILGKDSLFEASAGVLLSAHTPSGAGATGGAWTNRISATTSDVNFVSLAGGGFKGSAAPNNCLAYQAGITTSGANYVQAVVNFGAGTFDGGVGFVVPSTATDPALAPIAYWFNANGDGAIVKYWANTGFTDTANVATTTFSPAINTSYTLRLEISVSGSTVTLTAFVNGVSVGSGVDDGSIGSTGAAYTVPLYYSFKIYDGSLANFSTYEAGNFAIAPIAPNDPGYSYYGRWNVTSGAATTVNSGSLCEFIYTGNSCVLNFNTSSVVNSNYPVIAYNVDQVGWTRAQLDSSGLLTITPAYNTPPSGSPPFASVSSNRHSVQFMANIDSLYLETGNNWTNRTQGLIFLGASVASLLPNPTIPSTIEYLGDSITSGIRVLFTSGSDASNVINDAIELSWTTLVSENLGLKPIVNGHGGQSLTTPSTDGTPIPNTAFPFTYSGVTWNPTNKPVVVVIYQGTNAVATQGQYTTYLNTIRAAYPNAYIFGINPYLVNNGAAISAAIAAGDSKMFYLNYQNAFTPSDTSDNVHFNPGGAMAMASRLSQDIQTQLNILGVKVQAGGGGPVPPTTPPFLTISW